jgi:DNA polymerase/3'-5' exonuclease PolX
MVGHRQYEVREEEDLFKRLGLKWIEPELRERKG